MGEEAFFRLARLDEGETLASVAQIRPDLTGAFESAVNVSLLHSDPTGDRTLMKRNTHQNEKRAVNAS